MREIDKVAGDQKELDEIKRLLMLLLAKMGSSSEEIALALDVDASVIRRMLPMRKIKTLDLSRKNRS